MSSALSYQLGNWEPRRPASRGSGLSGLVWRKVRGFVRRRGPSGRSHARETIHQLEPQSARRPQISTASHPSHPNTDPPALMPMLLLRLRLIRLLRRGMALNAQVDGARFRSSGAWFAVDIGEAGRGARSGCRALWDYGAPARMPGAISDSSRKPSLDEPAGLKSPFNARFGNPSRLIVPFPGR